ncbi:beta-galactosidase-like [Macrobrachium nipponense]|uniref:beta-galactosidase-like n=1 Tax=Macrobrachium nipponense TaxID=159736 RepID=UPI0030C8B4BE
MMKFGLLFFVMVGAIGTGMSIRIPEKRSASLSDNARSFAIDYANDQFLKDGQPFRYISGSIHYFRTLPSEWRDRLRKLRMAGFNAVETYVEWSSHEPEPGVYDFSGILDLQKFLEIAQEEDLLVILRPGPFIDAERDMGGFPYWLLRKNKNMQLRTSDKTYLEAVDHWFGDILLPLVKPLLYENGGPIIMVQVENEYGSYPACDHTYTEHLRDIFRKILGDSILLFTTDGNRASALTCGKIPGVYATVDFGAGGSAADRFAPMREVEPRGPFVNSEYYPSWLDYWGDPHNTGDVTEIAQSLDDQLAYNASVNMYVFHGGTSFGFGAGSDFDTSFHPCPTSYDYDAPLSEAGDPSEKYWALRNITQKYLPLPEGDVPPPSPKYGYGKVSMEVIGSVFQMKPLLEAVNTTWPLTFEELFVSNGLVVYQTVIPFRIDDPATLVIDEIHDRGYVFVEDRYSGVVSRERQMYEIPIQGLQGQTLSIVVESQGRICYGPRTHDFKGITTNVTLSGFELQNWMMVPLPLTNISRLSATLSKMERIHQYENTPESQLRGTPMGGMSFYKGIIEIPESLDHPQDTFLKLDGWGKGIAWVNDFCLGRYWPEVGPQVKLYVPRGILQNGANTLILLEQEIAPCHLPETCFVSLEDKPLVDGPTPTRKNSTLQ